MELESVNAEWLDKKITQHYNGNQRAFSEDTNNVLKYSMITKHTTGGQKITERFKLTYFLWFWYKENSNEKDI